MSALEIVIDTSVFVSALRSRLGASYALLSLIDGDKFRTNVSVPLILEYEDVGTRMLQEIGLTKEDLSDILDYICSVSAQRKVFYLWRSHLPDPKDDMILEVAVAGNCKYIVTFNKKDFVKAAEFGIQAVTPQEFLRKIGVAK